MAVFNFNFVIKFIYLLLYIQIYNIIKLIIELILRQAKTHTHTLYSLMWALSSFDFYQLSSFLSVRFF